MSELSHGETYFSMCCEAPIVFLGEARGLFCGKCGKEVFHTIIAVPCPICKSPTTLEDIKDLGKCRRCDHIDSEKYDD
jgi:primosomal protein N'